MVNILLFLLFFPLFPTKAHAVMEFDAQAWAQRQLMHAEQKFQSLKLIAIAKSGYDNYQAAQMTYEMAKAGYEKVTDAKEWKALSEYERYRLKALANPTPDPHQSALYQAVLSLDREADAYVMQTKLYHGTKNFLSESGGAISRWDERSASAIDQNTPLGNRVWNDVSAGANSRTAALNGNASQRYLDESFQEASLLALSVQGMNQRAETMAEELDKINRMEFWAYKDYTMALEEMQAAGGDAVKAKKAQQRHDKAKSLLDEFRRQKADLQGRMDGLESEVSAVLAQIRDNHQKLELNAASLGISSLAKEVATRTGLSAGAKHADALAKVNGLARALFLVAICLAILWQGATTMGTGDQNAIPYEAIKSMFWAAFFLTSWPMMTREMAAIMDAGEETFFAGAVEKINTKWSNSLTEISGSIGNYKPEFGSDDPRLKDAYETEAKKLNVATGFTGTLNSMSMWVASLPVRFLQYLSLIVSYCGIASVVLSFSLRSTLFWVVATVAPLLIALWPLPFARQKLLPGVGMFFFAIYMWGPITKTMLILALDMNDFSLGFVNNLSAQNPMFSAMVHGINGFSLLILMVISPGLAFGLAQGSFDGLVNGLNMATTGVMNKSLSMAATPAGFAGRKLGIEGGGALRSMGARLLSPAAAGGQTAGIGRKMAGMALQGAGVALEKAGSATVRLTHYKPVAGTASMRSAIAPPPRNGFQKPPPEKGANA